MDFPLGTYMGITWSDHSPVISAEIELVVTKQAFTFRIATGLGINEVVEPAFALADLTPDEIRPYLAGDNAGRTKGLRFSKSGLVLLLLWEPTQEETDAVYGPGGILASDTARVCLVGLPGWEKHGATLLFLPEQVKAGIFRKTVALIEQSYGPYKFPRLEYGGKVSPE